MLELAAGDYALKLAPERGGAVIGFSWRGERLMRPAAGPAALDATHCPLVPFSMDIGEQPIAESARQIWLGSDPLDSLDWLTEWSVAAAGPRSVLLLDSRSAEGEAAPYVASQTFALDDDGLAITLSLVNLGTNAMPAALGVRALFAQASRATKPCARPFEMRWPGQTLTLVLEPSDNLAITGFTAPGENIRCCAETALLAPGGVASASLRLRAAVRR